VYGTHTHIQTNDAHILAHGTWILADVGMNGPFNSVIWAEYQSVEKRFLSGIQRWKIEQQLKGPYIINALVADIDEKTKHCVFIENISYTWTI
jgi:calcineurin-like phosphoesterase